MVRTTFAAAAHPFRGIITRACQRSLGQRALTLNLAVGNDNGTVPFTEAKDATMGSLAVHGTERPVSAVSCRTLDSIARELQIARRHA